MKNKLKNFRFLPLTFLPLLALGVTLLMVQSRKAEAYITGSPGVLDVSGVANTVNTHILATGGLAYSVSSTDRLIELYCTNTTVSIGFPTYLDGIALVSGNTLIIKNMTPFCTNTVSALNIDGSGSYALTNKNACIAIRYDGGTNWVIISKVNTP